MHSATSIVRRRSPTSRMRRPAHAKTRAHIPISLSFQLLEDRIAPSCDCYASLFAGPRLVSVDSNKSELMEGVFNALLPGSHVDLQVADWNAIASGDVQLNSLLGALKADLGLSTPSEALSADVSIAQILDATADAIPADGPTASLHAAVAGLSQDVNVPELAQPVRLGNLLQVTFPDGSFADASLNVFNLVSAVIELYNYENVATTNDPVTISGTVLNQPGINTLQMWAQIIEPPIIDPVVYEGDQFYSAAVRLKLNVDLVDFSPAGASNVSIGQIQLYLDVARAQGEVTFVHVVDAVERVVTVDASHGVGNVYLGNISDGLFFNRSQVVTPALLNFGTIGSVTNLLGQTFNLEAKAYSQGTAPIATALEFVAPFPQTQTTGTSATFVANALNDLLTSLEVRASLNDFVVPDPTANLRQVVADAIGHPLSSVLSAVGDPALQLLGTGLGEMVVTINATNCPPVTNNDTATTPEDTPKVIDVLANDRDSTGVTSIDPTTVEVTSGPSHGSTSVDPNTGTVTYTPDPDYNGPDSFAYTVRDTAGAVSCPAIVSIDVTAVNDAPVAIDDSYSTLEDTPLTVAAPGVLGNDFDVDRDPLTAVLVAGPSNGTVTLNSDGSFTYTPAANFNGTDRYTYRAKDPSNTLSNVATVTITVAPVNDRPVAANDSYTTAEDAPLTIAAPGVLANDNDVDNDPLTAVFVAGPNHGTVTLNSNGSFTYVPDSNFNGDDSFTYQAKDPSNTLSNVATVSIRVTPANDPPRAVNDAYSTNEDTPLTVTAPGVLGNDSDPENDPLSAILVASPGHGSVTLNSNGSFTYTPALNYNGPDSFTYRANDGAANSNVATVSISVKPVNDPPVAVNDSYTTNEDTALTIAAPGVLTNDSDVDGNTLTAIFVSGPSHGTVTLNSNGSFTYTPSANYNGPDSFRYKANDGTFDSNIATVNITVNPINDPPVAVNDSYTTNEDTQLSVTVPGVLANDFDVDGDPLTAILVGNPAHGTVTVNSNGSFTYSPASNYSGPDNFTYKANDGTANSNLATVAINVNPVNDPPVAVNDAYTTNEDTPLTVAAPGVLGNDNDVDGNPLSAILASGPGHGTVTLNSNGSFTYSPAANFTGSDTFTYRANDGTANSNIATVTITVNPINDPPVAANDAYTTAEDTALIVAAPGVLANDRDVDGDPLTAVLVSGPSHGTVTLNSNGSFTYSPATDFTGADSFTYKAKDPSNALSNLATVNITVTQGNDPPVAVNDAYSTNEDTPITVSQPGVLANDSDPDGDRLTSKLVSSPSHGTVTMNSKGSFTYTPTANFNGTDTFTYQANDGMADSNIATVTITVNAVNDAPIAVNDAYSTNEDTPVAIQAPGVLSNDSDADGNPLSAALVTGPSHGTVTLNSNGSFNYTPAANYNGPDSFTYRANDGTANSNVATVNITVIPVNDAPVANNDAYTTSEDTTLTIAAPGVLANDSDVDGNPLTAALVSGPNHGTVTLNSNGSFTYTPAANYCGSDSFRYNASDGSSSSNTATVSLTVTCANDAPVALNDAYNTNEDTPLSVAAPGVLANDSDAEGNPLTAVLSSGPVHGTVTLNSNGSFTYTPAANYCGSDSFSYRANDGTSNSNIATVSLTVFCSNDAPVAVNDAYNTSEDAPLTVAAPGVLGNDSDPDNDPLAANIVTAPSHGTLTLNSNGSFTYTPASNYSGPDSFRYQANDGTTNSNVATVNITVNPVNDAPFAKDDAYSTNEDTSLSVAAPGVLANDSDPEGNALSAILVTGPSHGTLTLNSNGSFTYTPSTNYNGPDSFTYKANDGTANSNVATANITVNPINDPPVAVNDAYSTDQNTTLTVAAPGVQANDSDIDSSSLTSILVSQPAHGTVSLNSNGSFSYTPDHNFVGSDRFTYRDNDGSADSNVATVTISVNALVADLSLTMTVNNSTPKVGGEVIFTITVANAGPSAATNVAANDTLPAGLSFVSATTSQGTYSASTGVWTIGTIGNGSNATLTLTAKVSSSGAKTNTAEVTASDVFDPDSTPNNHVATEDDQASRTVTPSLAAARVTHTDTTCSDYTNGAGTDLTRIEYGVRNGAISNVAPGVFFYYVQVQAPASNFTILIDQSEGHSSFSTLFAPSQIRFYDVSCTVSGLGTSSTANGDVTINVSGASAGQVFVVSIKYDTSTVVGQPAPNPSTVSYLFTTRVNGGVVSQDGVDLAKKGQALQADSGGASMRQASSSYEPLTLEINPEVPSGKTALDVFVDVQDPALREQIDDALAALNQVLSPLQMSLAQTDASGAASADIWLHNAPMSICGGLADGVLGCARDGGEITLIEGWNWYAGADAASIKPDQYDYQTVVIHEILHQVGLEHDEGTESIMHETLASGVAYRLPSGNEGVPWESNSPAPVGQPLPVVGVAGPGPDLLEWPSYSALPDFSGSRSTAVSERIVPAWDSVLSDALDSTVTGSSLGSDLENSLTRDSVGDSSLSDTAQQAAPWFDSVGVVEQPDCRDDCLKAMSASEIDLETLIDLAMLATS